MNEKFYEELRYGVQVSKDSIYYIMSMKGMTTFDLAKECDLSQGTMISYFKKDRIPYWLFYRLQFVLTCTREDLEEPKSDYQKQYIKQYLKEHFRRYEEST